MQRRAIILALGAATSPMVARAQPAEKLRSSLRVGLAGYLTNFGSAQNAFLQRLAELGFVEGRNLSFNSELTFIPNLDAAYADMVKDGVDILLALGPEIGTEKRSSCCGGSGSGSVRSDGLRPFATRLCCKPC